MQVSTSSLYSIPRTTILELQTKLAKAETEQSTGELADPGESLGSQLGLDETLQAQSASLDAMQTSNTLSTSKLTVAQNAIKQVLSDINTFTSAVITAQSTNDNGSLPTQASSLLSSLTTLLNATSGGVYVFGGTNTTAKPISDYSTNAQAATALAFQNAFGMSQTDSDVATISSADMDSFLSGSFSDLFTGSSWATNWSSASSTRTTALISTTSTIPTITSVTANEAGFQNIAKAYTMIADLGIDNMSATTRQDVLSTALTLANTAENQINGLQTELGLAQSQITNANSMMQTQATFIDNWVSTLGGVDKYEAAAKVSDLSNQLDVAYSLTSRIAKLGLINYLS